MLIELCKSVPLRICNGRKLGDILGSYTCYKNNGQSSVDYCCVSPNIWSIVSTFVINELYPDLSDHCSITVTLKTNYFAQFCMPKEFNLLDKPQRLKWDSSISLRFEHLIQTEQSRGFLSTFTSKNLTDQMSLDQAMSDFPCDFGCRKIHIIFPTSGAFRNIAQLF